MEIDSKETLSSRLKDLNRPKLTSHNLMYRPAVDTVGPDKDLLEEFQADDEWMFETDHSSLKNNGDYRNLIKTIALLECQRTQAIKDLDIVRKVKERALTNPMAFANGLQKNVDLHLPAHIKVTELPPINWDRYGTQQVLQQKTRQGRNKSKLQDMAPMKKLKLEDARSNIFVRGRVFNDSKPETFNQLWTSEEQQRLEELLVEYPPEEVEQNRWKKIAAELGNRTPKQVTSRIQKYFIKLHKAGLPVPGRVPRVYGETRNSRHHHQKHNHLLFRPTTFFPVPPPALDDYNCYDPPKVNGVQEQPLARENESQDCEENESKDDEDFEDETMPISEKIVQAKRNHIMTVLKRVQLELQRVGINCNTLHIGYKCEFCETEPLKGTRWHCSTCTAVSVDFCSSCVVAQLESHSPHTLSHNLVPISMPISENPIYDSDYTSLSYGGEFGYNYLDPNFMPE